MTPGVVRATTDEQNLERQMGCMAGFLHLFDRHQALAGKRLYAAKRLPASSAAGSMSPSERSETSVASSFVAEPQAEACTSSPESRASPAASPARPSLPLPLFEFKDGQRSYWKLRESPRLSLDSRAVVDAKGKLRPREIRTSVNQSDATETGEDLDKQRRSPSVVARLMGLETLPDDDGGGGEPPDRAELRRSASESRVSRDLSHYRFVDPSTFQNPPPLDGGVSGKAFRYRTPDSKPSPSPPRAPHVQRKSFFDAQDFFPDPKRMEPLYGEIERRLRMRGIEEPAKDLETLKQILEVLQLKGLLHSKLPPEHNQIDGSRCNNNNLVYNHHLAPIVIMKPAPKPPRPPSSGPPLLNRPAPPARTRRDRVEIERNPRSPDRAELTRSPTSPARRRQSNVSTPPPLRRSPAEHSPRLSPKRSGLDPLAVRSPRNRRLYSLPVDDDSTTTISETSFSNSSQFDSEDAQRSRVEEYQSGRSLLDRCDKLLHSIAAITSSPAEQQPSPVSVLDASSYLGGDESPSPSALKRSIDFKDPSPEWEEDRWSVGGATEDDDDRDLAYVSEILRAWGHRRDLSGVYAALERRRNKSRSPETSPHHRKLVFDAVAEILDRKTNLQPWDAFCRPAASGGAALLREVWTEVRVLPAAGDINDVICGAIQKDMAVAGDGGWGGAACAVEMSEAVLYIERQIFKDLVADTIRQLADVAGGGARPSLLCRKLVF